jgi:MraZ protein
MDGLLYFYEKVRMTNFRGRAHLKIDDKGRLSLPSQFRVDAKNILKSHLIITNNIYQGHRFLDLYTLHEWEKLEKKIALLPQLKSEVQAFQRFYLSSGEVCPIDSQWRMLVPMHLREYGKFQDEIVMIGMGHKIEIWNSKDWKNQFSQMESDFSNVMNVLAGLEESSVSASKNVKRKT